ncbi:MAG: T9SS type A sorting domain-containing protein [Ignavibacterium album]|uniref:T9SS type A sorting domain-containing protein n=1 Tax=Ignavibacterium album TaxID=591197 RepID=UPI0026E98492|nr:T9SS type A sorting domain-containing protein [Ignavibacterium album]MCX8106877.1 T9SS type A sorting domain-containing protein [Ignavibacterium album]
MKILKMIFFIVICSTILILPQSKKILNQFSDIDKNSYDNNFNIRLTPTVPKYFSLQDDFIIEAVYPLELSNGNLAVAWGNRTISNSLEINFSISSDEGTTWLSNTITTVSANFSTPFEISLLQTFSGRLLCLYALSSETVVARFYLFYSDDLGNTWAGPIIIGNPPLGVVAKNFDLSQKASGEIYLTYKRSDGSHKFRKSTDNGISWSSEYSIATNPNYYWGKIIPLDDQYIGFIFLNKEQTQNSILIQKSSDDGLSWSSPQNIYSDTSQIIKISTSKTTSPNIHIALQKNYRENFYLGYFNYGVEYELRDVFFIKSTDNGNTWSAPEIFTQYKGKDNLISISSSDDNPFVFFNSTRFLGTEGSVKIWFGRVGLVNDRTAPPVKIYDKQSEAALNTPITINTIILNTNPITQIILRVFQDGTPLPDSYLYDDGQHNDGNAGDNVWGNIIGPYTYPTSVSYQYIVSDSASNQITFLGGSFNFYFLNPESFMLDVNRLKLPIGNNGVIADVTINGSSGGAYDEGTILFSGGFLLSGYKNNQLWANGVMTSSRILDYLPGTVDTSFPSTNSNLFVIKASDPDFSNSWLEWTDAVNYGADFYDGNGDGLYTPVDFNGNGDWDESEDRPGLIGNVTTFFVCNDRMPSSLRRFNNMIPLGIEIRQSTYAFSNNDYSLNEAVFVKYEIANKSGSQLDSVYFSVVSDPDIGGLYSEDLFGSDTLLNSTYVYKASADNIYGSNPPALFNTLAQGPVVYIPGETFSDINGNGIFDPGTDISLDTAFNIRGTFIGIDTLPGAKNLLPTSMTHYMSSHPTQGDMSTVQEVRNLQIGGLTTHGLTINPCNWQFGLVNGVDCNSVNPNFLYSGDPVNNIGWINNFASDQRSMLSVGPFNLANNESKIIVVAYVGGRGNSPKNSVTIGKFNVGQILEAYNNNFPVIVSVEDKFFELPSKFNLYQNYPNPFNPSTKIRWQAQVASHQTLKVYDILGNEVATLVDEFREAGGYEINFDASSLASGIYIYKLIAGSFISSKKMMIIK